MNEGPRVLYIDDDPGLARLVSRTLERNGYRFAHAQSGDEGLERLGAEAFDVVALDHHMPGQTGLQVLDRIRQIPDAPPVVFVTGSEDSRVAVAAMKAGAVDYVWKDVQGHFRDLLVEAISGALEKEELRRAKEAADREIREAKERAELLLREVNHRVANSLALVASFAHMQSNAARDLETKSALEEVQNRIHAIAGLHRRLYTSQNVDIVDVRAYLAGLVEELESSMRAAGRDHAITLDAESLNLPTDKAVSLGVIVTELVTNAYKYAYPDGKRGSIRVQVKHEGDGALLVIEDDGIGWQGDGPVKGSGLGMRVVKAMAANLRSAVVFNPDHKGTCASVRFLLNGAD